jgi:hypothetical protein
MSEKENVERVIKSLHGDVDKLAEYIYDTYCTYGVHDAAYSKKAIAALIRAVQQEVAGKTFEPAHPH